MSSRLCVPNEKPREWRRKVLVTARIRSAEGWADARILNVSSRGLMIRTTQATNLGSMIEFRRGDQVFFARVVWECGARAGLRSESILPVTELICVSKKLGDSLPLWPSPVASAERRPNHEAIAPATATARWRCNMSRSRSSPRWPR